MGGRPPAGRPPGYTTPSARTSHLASPSKKPSSTCPARFFDWFKNVHGPVPPLAYHHVCPVARNESAWPSPSKSQLLSSSMPLMSARLSLSYMPDSV